MAFPTESLVVDTSAILALVFGEPEAAAFASALEASPNTLLSTASYVEATAVLGRARAARIRPLLSTSGIALAPVDAEQAERAADAYLRFGRGSGSQARLNFGDCFSYALASVTGRPLLFKGHDFNHTDITSAL